MLGKGAYRARRFGAGKFSEVFAIQDGAREYVLRVAPPDDLLQLFYEYRMMRQEPAIYQRLRAETQVPVPEILAHDFFRRLIDRDFLIMPRLNGQPLSRAALSAKQRENAISQWGQYVRQIHSLSNPQNRFGYLGQHHCMEPQSTWPQAFAVMYGKLLDDIVGCGIYDRQTATEALNLLQDNLQVFEHCRTSQLCHGDLWVTNLLVGPNGDVTGVLDFDRACWGDIEWDLAIAEYCGVTSQAFWDGYGKEVETHRDQAALRRLFYLLYEHQKYIVISMSLRRSDPAGARRYAAESLSAMDQFRRTGQPRF